MTGGQTPPADQTVPATTPQRPAWTTGWGWAGAAVFFGGLLIAGRAVGGYGNPAECGFLRLSCLVQAAGWLVVTQSLAAVLLWIAVLRLPAGSRTKRLCVLTALMPTLVLLTACGALLSVTVGLE